MRPPFSKKPPSDVPVEDSVFLFAYPSPAPPLLTEKLTPARRFPAKIDLCPGPVKSQSMFQTDTFPAPSPVIVGKEKDSKSAAVQIKSESDQSTVKLSRAGPTHGKFYEKIARSDGPEIAPLPTEVPPAPRKRFFLHR
jgi:hypothetical protein